MSSIGSILSIARTALQTHQIAIQTASHNIANADVEGYSAQSVRSAANHPQLFPYGNVGTGVVVQGVTRARNVLLDDQFRAATGNAAGYGTTSDVLSRIEAVMGEPNGAGIAAAMDAFWDSWSDLASDPADSGARGVVKQRGVELAGVFNSFAAQLDTVDRGARSALGSEVAEINALGRQLAELNPAIVAAEAGGRSANDLRDERDRLVDRLSSLAQTQSVEQRDGSLAVYVAGRLFVDQSSSRELTLRGNQPVSVGYAGDPDALTGIGGRIGASLDAINTRVPGALRSLDALAGTLVNAVNSLHITGTVYTGNPPVAASAGKFFNQVGALGSTDSYLTARGMSLNGSVAELSGIAAAGAGATGPGNNAMANEIAGLRDRTMAILDSSGATVANTTLAGFYRDTVAAIGLATSQASSSASVHSTLATQADARRDSVSGVATDEELVQLIKHQQAYAAAARLVSVVDEMSRTLISLGQ